MSLPRGEEITDHIRAHWLQLASALPSHQQRVLNGPRTDQQRLMELQMVLDSAILASRDRFLQRGDRGVIVGSEDGSHFWFLAFANVEAALPGLPADARETLDMARQVYNPSDEAVVALLLPERRVRLLYLARDGMRGQVYQRASNPMAPTPARPAEREAPSQAPAERISRGRPRPGRGAPPPTGAPAAAPAPGLIGHATTTEKGYLIRVRHPERGLLGQVSLTQIDPEHMLVEAVVAGHEDDPTTADRRALLDPVVEALKRGFASVKTDRATAQAHIAAVLTGGVIPPDIPRQIPAQAIPCPHCEQPAFFLIFGEDSELTLDDYGRMMFEPIRGYGVPAWVVRAGPEGFGLTEARQLHPNRGPVVMITSVDLDAMIQAEFAAHQCELLAYP